MNVYFISLNLWESLENFTNFLKTTCQVDSKELFLMVKHIRGYMPAQEVLFSRKKKTQSHPEISLNNIPVERSSYQKHVGLILDEKLNFKQHIDNAISKINKGIAVIKELRYSLSRKSLITIYKAFLQPLIDYGDIIHD